MNFYLDSTQKENKLLLIKDNKIIDRQSFTADNNSDSQLLTEIEKFLKTNQFDINKIDVLIVNIGPGSFTGTRNGITLANALKLARPELKLVGLSNPNEIDIISALGDISVKILTPIYSSAPSITKPKK